MASVYHYHSTNLYEHTLCALCTASSSAMSPSQPCRPCSLQQAFTKVLVALGLWAWTPPGGLPPSSLQSSSWKLTIHHIVLMDSDLWRWLRLLPFKQECYFPSEGAAIPCRPTGKAWGCGVAIQKEPWDLGSCPVGLSGKVQGIWVG